MIPAAALSPPDLADAQRKIAAYLRACGLYPAAAAKASAALLESALQRPPANAPVSAHAAVTGVLDLLDRWPAGLAPEHSGENLAHARARLFLAAVPARWPEALLTGTVPPELRTAVSEVALQLAPELQQSAMTPQPLDLGPVSEAADETWRTFDKWPFLRGVTIWALFALLLCAVFYSVRF